MKETLIRPGAEGRLDVVGDLSFATVPGLRTASQSLFAQQDEIRIDLKDVVRSDSAGLALMVEWMRAAKRDGKPIQFLNMPPQMLAIARVSSLDKVLPLSRG